jgi:hypothetical protein
MGLLNGQPMAKGNLRYVKVSSSIDKAWTVSQLEEEKPLYKNQGREPIDQKYKGNESISRHNPKKNK